MSHETISPTPARPYAPGSSGIANDLVLHEVCVPAPYPTGQGKGRWEIVSGTGAYANLNGNGSLTMPGNEEAMTGFIYR